MSSASPPIRASLEELIALRNQVSLKILLKQRVSTLRLGSFQSTFRGRGMDFEEVRGYQAGDDIRNMDWRVTARTGQAHTKIFREERERPVYFVVDQGQNMRFGTRVMFKSVMAARLAGMLAWGFLDMGDRIGATVFTDEAFCETKAQRGKHGVLSLLNLLSKEIDKEQNRIKQSQHAFSVVLKRLIRIVRPGSLIFFISDFSTMDREEIKYISMLSKHCELVAIDVFDQIEKSAPPPGIYSISNGEDFITVNTSDAGFVDTYESIYRNKLELLQTLAIKYNIHLFHVATHDDRNKIVRETLAPLCRVMGVH